MRLYLMRHATAVPHGAPGYPDDRDRPLTDAGREQARRVTQGLKRLKLPLDAIYTSPYVRAAQTADEAARVLGGRIGVKALDELRAEVEPRETSLALKAAVGHDHAVFVGHEPHLSAWLAELTSAQASLRCIMKKAGVACVEVDRVPPPGGSGTLRWLMTPKQLMAVGA
jgi:phosphohistidine phosphatase